MPHIHGYSGRGHSAEERREMRRTGNYTSTNGTSGTNSLTGLPNVSDPDQAYANMTRQEYLDFVANYSGFEDDLINKAKTDTSLIDAAREDSVRAAEITAGVSDRMRQRYGAALTPAQMQQQDRALQRGSTLGQTQAVNDARIAQREANTALMSDLINIGQGVNRSSQNQLGSAASDATQRKNAYMQARAASKAQTYQTVGSLASSAILAFAFLSDRSAKMNIKKVGVSKKGTNIYEFNYIGSKDRYRGVMADEVPHAVVGEKNGYMLVDYNKTDVKFKKVS